jgi:hypothetical protein
MEKLQIGQFLHFAVRIRLANFNQPKSEAEMISKSQISLSREGENSRSRIREFANLPWFKMAINLGE